ncbi:MAG: hypothetical protein AAFU78_02235 [Cyanobacteria bacterium J06633_2]
MKQLAYFFSYSGLSSIRLHLERSLNLLKQPQSPLKGNAEHQDTRKSGCVRFLDNLSKITQSRVLIVAIFMTMVLTGLRCGVTVNVDSRHKGRCKAIAAEMSEFLDTPF